MPPYLLACILSLAAPVASAPASAATGKVAIIDGIHFRTEGLHTTVPEADHFYKVLLQELAEKGWTPIAPPVSQDVCRGSIAGRDCLAYIARESGAAYVLRLTGEGNLKEGYALRLEAYSAATKHSQRSNDVCDVCLTDDIAHSAAELSLGLLADAVKDDAETRRADELRNENAALARSLTSASPTIKVRHLAWIPWSLVGAGVVGIALGSWWIHEDGRSKGFRASSPVISEDYYSSKSLGIASLIGGVALLAGGTIWLAITPSSTASVSASPNHVAFSLRY